MAAVAKLRLLFVFLLLGCTVTTIAGADPQQWFAAGRRLYQAGDYAGAVQRLEQAASAEPDNSEYQHWLGKAYGRLAEQSGWLRAISLAKKTRAALERAVSLDPLNRDAVADLIEYYRTAPAFLGGGKEKARALARRERRLREVRTGTD